MKFKFNEKESKQNCNISQLVLIVEKPLSVAINLSGLVFSSVRFFARQNCPPKVSRKNKNR